ncbi:uncharacterized protein N7459_006426 [Penicillium hispanicum]|uniref:uncharacterized protein n=1 Tax=Penicillium hispanicum TaxID=1080232 RepID=UPI002541B58D|nr:uncharacterized protein N7459_006426 [Penicillium hispanicum]KAJ5577462.1 hypothetical protein N7459_006426 [Penicillium hispanicum]
MSLPNSENQSDNSLPDALAGLSLTDTPEAGTVKNGPRGLNPFTAVLPRVSEKEQAELDSLRNNPFLRFLPLPASAGDQVPVRRVETLAQDVIPQYVSELQQPRRFTLNESEALYIQARKFQEKWGISEKGFLNWIKLLSGWIGFPAVMLLNPRDVDESPTLSWVRETLEKTELGLDDVIIFDTFPMLRSDLGERVFCEGPDKLKELALESFALTKASLALIQPWVLLSCQCCTKSGNEKWDILEDELVQQLCSSVTGAMSGQVREVKVGEHQMHVVLGMHPRYVTKWESAMKTVLVKRFAQVFTPFGKWQSQRTAIQQMLQGAGVLLLNTIGLLRLQVQFYRQLCKQEAQSYGVEVPVAESRMQQLEAYLREWQPRE